MVVKRLVHRMMVKLAVLPTRLLPSRAVRELAVAMLCDRARRLPADAGLRLLFEVDARLYRETGLQSKRYGGGVHTKHRHTNYHQFFIDNLQPDDRVLDVGCGQGAVASDVAERAGVDVVAVDYSPARVEQAKRQHPHPRVEYRVADATTDLPGERFDAVILSNVLEHIDDRPKLLRQLRESIQPRRILVRVPCFERDWRVPLKRELGVEWRLDTDHRIEYNTEQLGEEARQAGLSIAHLQVRWGEIWTVLVPDENADR